jgi:hypothetical protein
VSVHSKLLVFALRYIVRYSGVSYVSRYIF